MHIFRYINHYLYVVVNIYIYVYIYTHTCTHKKHIDGLFDRLADIKTFIESLFKLSKSTFKIINYRKMQFQTDRILFSL